MEEQKHNDEMEIDEFLFFLILSAIILTAVGFLLCLNELGIL